MRLTPAEKYGAASCTSYIGNDLGGFIGPSLAGLVAQFFGFTALWIVMIVPVVCAFILALLSHRHLGN
jgi:predicted MFS family arabinose efflux permease